MTREEQINEAVNTYMNGLFEDGIEIPIENFKNIEEGFIAGAAWADNYPKSPWIAVEDKLPEIGQAVFIRTSKSTYGVSWIDYDLDWQGGVAYSILIVTHWMPIPNLPK